MRIIAPGIVVFQVQHGFLPNNYRHIIVTVDSNTHNISCSEYAIPQSCYFPEYFSPDGSFALRVNPHWGCIRDTDPSLNMQLIILHQDKPADVYEWKRTEQNMDVLLLLKQWGSKLYIITTTGWCTILNNTKSTLIEPRGESASDFIHSHFSEIIKFKVPHRIYLSLQISTYRFIPFQIIRYRYGCTIISVYNMLSGTRIVEMHTIDNSGMPARICTSYIAPTEYNHIRCVYEQLYCQSGFIIFNVNGRPSHNRHMISWACSQNAKDL